MESLGNKNDNESSMIIFYFLTLSRIELRSMITYKLINQRKISFFEGL